MCAEKPSALYAVINKATTNIPSHYAVPAVRNPVGVEKERKMKASTCCGLCKEPVVCEEVKGCDVSPSIYSNLETEQEINRRNKKSSHSFSVKFALVIVFVFVLIVIVSMFTALFLQMRNLHEMNKALQKSVEKLNIDKNKIPEQTNLSHLYNLVLSMDNKIKQINISFKNSYESIKDYISAQNRQILTSVSPILDFYFSFCSDISMKNSSYASGNYIVRSSTGVLRSVYCDRIFDGNSIGWMRVAELDVNNCPPGLRHELTNSVSTCVVMEGNPGCTEIIYPVYNTQYTQIVGQIRGYQIKSSDGFVSVRVPRPTNFTNLNSNYLDGVSISTNGQHVWSFAAGCNCLNTRNKPTIIGQDYTCDGIQAGHFEYDGLLWASQQCGRNSTWFYKVLSPTTTDIKVRICRDQFRSDEDLAINTLILYIQ